MTSHDDQLAMLVSMGFDVMTAQQALLASDGDLEGALGYLLSEHEEAASTPKDSDKKKHTYGVSVRPKHDSKQGRYRYPHLTHGSQAQQEPCDNSPKEYASSSIYQNLSTPRQDSLEESKGDNGTSPNGTPKESQDPAPSDSDIIPTTAQKRPVERASVPRPSLVDTRHLSAEASQGTISLPPPFAPGPGDEETLVSAKIVYDERQYEPVGPLFMAPPSDDAVSRGDMKTVYIFVCCLGLLLVIIGVAVALLLLLFNPMKS